MMTPQQLNEIYRKLKSVPAGKREKAKEKVQATKKQQPMAVKAEQKKKYISATPPSRTKRRTCCGR